jgi:hypothetical protein
MAKQFDNYYISGNNDAYNAQNEDNVLVIKQEDLKQLNDPNCEHDLQPDDDEIGDTRAWMCSKCGRGVFLPKSVTKVT